MSQTRILLLTFCLFLSGCLVGPNYCPPITTLPVTFSETQEGAAQMPEEDLACWWQVFNDPMLNALLAESVQGNFDLLIAVEKIHQARATFRIAETAFLPEFVANLGVTRSRSSETVFLSNFLPRVQNYYQFDIDALWTIDLFGGLRRAARAAYDTFQSTLEDARNVRLLVLAEVAQIYTNIRSLQELEQIAHQTVRVDEELLQLAEARFNVGLANEQEIETAKAVLDADKAAILVLEIQIRQAIYSLAVLVGRPPETFLEQFLCERGSIPIPDGCGKVPCNLPSDLLRRRPDIRSAERNIAAATENIGVAVANLFPQISLTGQNTTFRANPLQGANIGYASNSFSKWLTSPSRIWGIGLALTQSIFDFGERMAIIAQQTSIQHQNLYTYEKTVIAALQEVESNLIAYFNEELRLEELTQRVEADQKLFDLASSLYKSGLSDHIQALNAEKVLLSAQADRTSSRQVLTLNLIAVYKAMGGGWGSCFTPNY